MTKSLAARGVSSVAIIVAGLVATLVAACRAPAVPERQPAAAVASTPPAAPRPEVALGLTATFELALAAKASTSSEGAVDVATLPPGDAIALLATLPALPNVAPTAPTLRRGAPPPPKTGGTLEIPLLARSAALGANALPAVLPPMPLPPPKIWPQGETEAVEMVRVEFSRPVVPLAQLRGAPAVAELTPPVAGAWRWQDTQTLVFEPSGKLPQATSYEVRVPAGLAAVDGGVLASDATGAFRTPAVALDAVWPSETKVLPSSPIVLAFNQAVDPARMLASLRASHNVELRVVTLGEAMTHWRRNPSIDLDELASQGLADDDARNVLVVAPTTAWPVGKTVTIELAAGAASAEGPRVAMSAMKKTFQTAPRFFVQGVVCGDERYETDDEDMPRAPGPGVPSCLAGDGVALRFSNPLRQPAWDGAPQPAAYRFDPRWIQIATRSAADGDEAWQMPHDVDLWSNDASIDVTLAPRADHAIAVSTDVQDIFGQTLAAPATATFRVKSAPVVVEPAVSANTGLYQLDPGYMHPHWAVTAEHVASVKITLYRVDPSMYEAYETWAAERARKGGKPGAVPGVRVSEKTYAVGAGRGKTVREDLLGALSKSRTGHVIAIAEAKPLPGKAAVPAQIAWIAVSRLTMATRIDGQRASVFVSDAIGGAAVGGAAVVLSADGERQQAQTDGDGQAVVSLLGGKRNTKAMLRVTTATDDMFVLLWNRWQLAGKGAALLWHVEDDRGMYQPGERIAVKGFVRKSDNGPNPPLLLPKGAIAYQAYDARGTRFASGQAALSPRGGFHATIEVPETVALGFGRIEFKDEGDTGATLRHPLRLMEFARPAFEVDVTADVLGGGAPVIMGEQLTAAVQARYYGGGAMVGAGVRWRAEVELAPYTPPGWDDFEFGDQLDAMRFGRDRVETLSTTISDHGGSEVQLALGGWNLATPAVVTLEATVTDVDRTNVRAAASPVLVHPASRYVGIKAGRLVTSRQAGHTSRVPVALVASDIAGKALSGVPIHAVVRGYLPSEFGDAGAKSIVEQACDVVSGSAPVACDFDIRDSLRYALTAEIVDERRRLHRTTTELATWHGEARKEPVAVRLDKASYRPGETAQIAIDVEAWPASAIVTYDRQGIITSRRVELRGPTTELAFVVDAGYAPNVHVMVDVALARARPGVAPFIEQLRASAELQVDTSVMRLHVVPTSAPTVRPGQDATFDVAITDAAGGPVAGAEVALMVVDEAVLALSNKIYGDPLPPFYPNRGQAAWGMFSGHMMRRALLSQLTAVPGSDDYELAHGSRLWGAGMGTGGGSGSGSGYGGGIGLPRLRADFTATAVFAPNLVTDKHGRVSFTGKMPDSVTRYRIVAIAAAGVGQFGKGEAAVVAQQPLQARLVAPSVLAVGDTFGLPVVVQNLSGRKQAVKLALRASNLALPGDLGKRVVLAPGARAEVRFAARTMHIGVATVQVVAVGEGVQDAMQSTLQVVAPATTQAVAVYGELDAGVAWQALTVPDAIHADVGGFELSLASTQLQALTDAYLYLATYAYECGEQISARMLATHALNDVLSAFGSEGALAPQALATQALHDDKRLAALQANDGGFSFWPGDASDAFVSVQVAHALVATGRNAHARAAAMAYLKKLTMAARSGVARDKRTTAGTDTLAYAFYVRRLAGEAIGTELARYLAANKPQTASVATRALTVLAIGNDPTLAAQRRALVVSLGNSLSQTASVAHATEQATRGEHLFLQSSARTNALVLLAMLSVDKTSPALPKLARGLLAAKSAGRWRSTQENLWVLLALRAYFDAFEGAVPAFTARGWVGDGLAVEQKFAGRQLETRRALLPWTELGADARQLDIAIAKEGAGRLYYRLGIRYAPQSSVTAAAAAGFVVERTYAAIDDAADVVRAADGTWRIKLGARVAVHVMTRATARRDQVAVVDHLAGGLQAINGGLATSERGGVARPAWANYQAIRMDRVETFAGSLTAGLHGVSYTARAMTPGRFTAAPARAEEMYAPEVFGHSASDLVIVE
ncbi:MAG: hypothetical protein IPL79_18430 [Myxococcales bacterium]|nr:hypothetical protein [Myxococcales bacterium]